MTALFVLGVRTVWLFGIGLVLAGFLGLAYFVAHLVWQFGASGNEVLGATLRFMDQSLLRPGIVAPVVEWLPQIPPALLTTLNIAMAVAVAGIGLAALGLFIAGWQDAMLDEERRQRENRLRRVQIYRDSGRVEPFIGPGAHLQPQDAKERRVA
ncbi:MAG: hypothetical protein ACREUN_00935 [Burkholderiales bacterium]